MSLNMCLAMAMAIVPACAQYSMLRGTEQPAVSHTPLNQWRLPQAASPPKAVFWQTSFVW